MKAADRCEPRENDAGIRQSIGSVWQTGVFPGEASCRLRDSHGKSFRILSFVGHENQTLVILCYTG